MTRKEIKRALALLKSEVELGRDHRLDLPAGFRKSFEAQRGFLGWINYHVTWDVDDHDAWRVVPLLESRVRSWHKQLEKLVPVLTEDGVVSAEEYAKSEDAE